MKRISILIIAVCITSMTMGQWILVNNGLGSSEPTSMYAAADTIILSQYGDGISRTFDNGIMWSQVNGDLPNLNVNKVSWGASSRMIYVATDNGAFFSQDMCNYEDCTSTGLSTTDIDYFWYGGDNQTQFAIGSNGGGVFASPDYFGAWTAYNNGLSGNALDVNCMGGYSDGTVDYAVMGSNNGVYFSTDNFASWVESNSGLSGDALIVNDLSGLGSMVLIATDGGLYMTFDNGVSWTGLIPGVKLNCVFIAVSGLSSTGFFAFALGQNCYYSEDFTNYTQMNMNGTSGEVKCGIANSTNVFIATGTPKDGSTLSGEVYRQPISEVVGINDISKKENANKLSQNYPNPFNNTTTINYTLDESAHVSLKFFSSIGKETQSFVNEYQKSGEYSISINAKEFNERIYYYTLYVNNIAAGTKKMIILD